MLSPIAHPQSQKRRKAAEKKRPTPRGRSRNIRPSSARSPIIHQVIDRSRAMLNSPLMPILPNTRLGTYEILEPLGAGGMGEVYRARDTRLGREVAVKVLPEAVAGNPDRQARFEREAKTVSSLNHPHICTLFDVGREGDTDYLVMEMVQGETLAERLRRSPLPI